MNRGRFSKFDWQYAVCSLPFAILVFCSGCWSSSPSEVVAYTALDAEFSRPVFEDIQRETGIQVLPKFDVESTKTVGLAEAIIAEGGRPRCDVFWNNEILHTVRLARAGLLEAYRSPAARDFPPEFRSPDGYWQGFAARARVLIVNTRLVPADRRPTSIRDLAAARWKGRCGMAKPLFGTTATHAACLFAAWGDAKAEAFFKQIKKNEVKILSGNKGVAQAVAGGQLDFGLTDTDDALGEVEQGMPVAVVYPDQEWGGLGTLFIPNTLAIVRGAPHPENARRLVDALLAPAVETKLAEGPSGQIPLNPRVKIPLRVETPQTVRPMRVDFEKAADFWEKAAKFLRQEFTS
jgi:iron(III) transport system substrate-binding protein